MASANGLDEPVGPGTIIAGRYEVKDRIAEGGLSVVYRVEHVHTGERFAMKVLGGRARLDPEAIHRFKREARTASRLRSEHVALVTDADTAPELGGSPFMVMELLRGSDLESYATREGPLAPDVVVRTLAQVTSVLSQAHRLGIVHRDLKPENLFLHERSDGTSVVKVLDFGISKYTQADGDAPVGVTSTGAVLGTPLYMAPEQAHGKNDEVGPATDIWAMGLVALRLLTGEHYWGHPTMAELMTKITALPLVPPSERWPESRHMSPALDAWFFRSCDRDRTKRWSSADEQLSALARALGVAPPSTEEAEHEDGAREASAGSKRRPRTVVASAIALALVASLPLFWRAARSGPDAKSEPGPPERESLTNGPPARGVVGVAAAASVLPSASAEDKAPPPDLPPTKLTASPRTARAPASGAVSSSAGATSAKGLESMVSCASGEVLSFGHCCPPAHVWQSGRCTRPIATSF